jgi:ligand-binding sensor domain-containing protein
MMTPAFKTCLKSPFPMLCATLIVCIILQPSFGQRRYFNLENFSERNPQIIVNHIHQDANGLIWLGTSNGLFSYDGINYQAIDETGSENISYLSSGSENNLFAGTDDGAIIIIQLHTRHAEILKTDSIRSRVTGMIHRENQVLVSTYGDGLWSLENGMLQQISGISDYSISEIYSMDSDNDGSILLGTDDGLCTIDALDKKCTFLTIKHGLPDNIVTVVQTDRLGNTWLGFHQKGFCQLQGGKSPDHIFNSEWTYGAVTTINAQLDSQIFVGTDSGWLLQYHLKSREVEVILKPENNNPHIHDVLVDKEANLWVSDQQNGLRKSSLFFSFVDLPASFGNKNVQAIFMDNRNQLWFTTEDGLYQAIFDGASTRFIKHLNSDVYGSTFISLYGDGSALWIGTFGVGLLYYQPQTEVVHSFKEKHGLANDNVLSIAGTEDKIWFATLGGASEAIKSNFGDGNPVTFNNYHGEDGLGTEYIYQVLVDSRGDPWFATDGKGLTTMKNGKFVNYGFEHGLDSKVIYSISEDTNNNIWLGTPKNGIYKFDGTQFENYNLGSDYNTKQISTIYAVGQKLIIIHKFGIDLLHENTIRSFGLAEGIGEINPDLNAVTRDQDGNLWIGHQEGIIKLNTGLYSNDQPEVLITKILVNLNPLEEKESRIFSYDENYLTFNYLGLWYSDPQNIRYEYKLEGINENWVGSRDNFVTFPNLPAGQYLFSVRVSASDDFVHANAASYQFTIRAPYWEKLWFYILLMLIGSAIIGSVFYLRDKSLKNKARIEQEKIQFQFETLKSQINPHFLFNSFNTLISIIEEEPGQATEYVEKLSDFFRNILQLREKDTISLREEIQLTMAYTYLQEKRFGDNFSLQINIPDRWLETAIPPLTLQLLAENAIKHNVISSKKPLTLRIYLEQEFIVVQNEIQTKKKPEASTSYGLENIIKRYQLLTQVPVEISKDELNFTVKLPLINR